MCVHMYASVHAWAEFARNRPLLNATLRAHMWKHQMVRGTTKLAEIETITPLLLLLSLLPPPLCITTTITIVTLHGGVCIITIVVAGHRSAACRMFHFMRRGLTAAVSEIEESRVEILILH